MTESRAAKYGLVLTAVGILLATAIGIAAWLYPRSKGLPAFEGAVASMQEIEDFDNFITGHNNERVHISVNFPDDSAFMAGRDTGQERYFVLGDVRCRPLREICENRYSYRLTGMPKNNLETVFGWGGEQQGYFLRGTYFVAGFGIQMGINWRTAQAVPAGSSPASS